MTKPNANQRAETKSLFSRNFFFDLMSFERWHGTMKSYVTPSYLDMISWFAHHTLLMHVQVYEAMYIHRIHSFLSHHSLDCLLPWMYSSDKDSSIGDSSEEERQHKHVRKMMFMAAFTMANIIATAALIYTDPLYNKVPYHTSALSGTD